jgi:phenylpyruvate tautomerase PptA (4-oxalocrotonate tautomerase family)
MIIETVKLIATTKKIGVAEFFSETEKSNKTDEAVKAKITENPNLAKALQRDELTPQQKEAMLNEITDTVMQKLGYKTHENKVVSTDTADRDGKQVKGFYSQETKTSYRNDKNIDDTADLVKTAGWKSTRAMDDQDGQNFNQNREDRANYADSFGNRLSTYTNGALNINGYNGMSVGFTTSGNNLTSEFTWSKPLTAIGKDFKYSQIFRYSIFFRY